MPRTHQINPDNIPGPFQSLIPYAEKWGINDYTELSNLIDETPVKELQGLVRTISDFDADGFDEWLVNPGENNRTKDWIAFILLIDACDIAKMRLQEEDDNKSTDTETSDE